MRGDDSAGSGRGALPPPTPIRTERLLLRPFGPPDAVRVQELAGEREIAENTTNIPHPYEAGVAEEWIESQAGRHERGEAVVFAIELAEAGELVGAIGLELALEHERAEMGYWIGRPFWGCGYATEAAGEVLRYGFEDLGLNRIQSCHFSRNPASGRVLQKIGMRREGSRRQYLKKWGALLDLEDYAMLRSEFDSGRESPIP